MILFAGDPHGRFDHLYPFLKPDENGQLPAVILLGDIQIHSPNELDELAERCDLWFIHGNHDTRTPETYDALWGEKWKDRNLHRKVKTIQGVRISGLGGVFRGKIWMPPNKPMYHDPIHFCQYCYQENLWRQGLPLRHRATIFPSDIEALANQKADILVTHEAPKPNPYGFAVLNRLAQKMGVKHIFHGHHHENYVYPHFKKYSHKVTNVGFRSLADINGHHILTNIDDR